jgi:molybdopterin/thiamine biosynthesis adenylyltransferase
MSEPFRYEQAFIRNLGWFRETEQQRLRTSRVAIAGMGGVGGSHLLTLARLGTGRFHIADLDRFELANFNRQAGANTQTLDRPKAATMAEMAQAINPEAEIAVFDRGVNEDNLDAFLEGVDLYIDGLDYFAVEIRRAMFARCAEMGIPAITAAPLGMGTATLVFLPGRMTFEQYFRLADRPRDEQLVRFLLGLAPAMLQQPYLVDPSYLDLPNERGPSTAIGCELCAGVAAAQAVKLLLGRGRVRAAPHSLQFDAFRNRFKHCWLPGGNAHPLQRLKIRLAMRQLARR